MRWYFIGLPLLAVFLLPSSGAAQVYQLPETAPIVTASNASWRGSGQPIYYAGSFYYPSGPTEFFDGQTMSRTGVIDGVPVYENRTLEPWSVVFVPIGGNVMQPYERRRSGPLAGTVGSRTPGQPIQRDVELSVANDSVGDRENKALPATSGRAQWTWPTPLPDYSAPPLAPLSARAKTASTVPVIRTIPKRETTNAGPYVDFSGVHYYSSGKAVTHDEQGFTKLGVIGGAAVFRAAGGSEKTIYVEVVPDGPLAPYTRP